MISARHEVTPERRRPARCRGVSLIEILFVALLVGVALFPLYDILTSSERGSVSSVNRVKATNYAADLLETIKAIPFDALPITEDNGTVEGWPDNEVADHLQAQQEPTDIEMVDLGARITPVTTGGDFSRLLAISEVSIRGEAGAWGGLKQVVVTVQWKEVMSGKRTDSQLRMAYLVSREGVSQK